MKIRCGHHIEINAFLLHLCSEKSKSVLNYFVFHCFVPFKNLISFGKFALTEAYGSGCTDTVTAKL